LGDFKVFVKRQTLLLLLRHYDYDPATMDLFQKNGKDKRHKQYMPHFVGGLPRLRRRCAPVLAKRKSY
jgi:hypothetical protein